MTDNDTTTHRHGDPYRTMLETLDAAPHAQAREQALRLLLAQAWHEGWETCYDDGGEDNNAYMTGREILDRRASREAESLARCLGATSVSVETINPDGTVRASGSWGQA